jgi:photosystem II stability/assembly factor-like uncharacterized protein
MLFCFIKFYSTYPQFFDTLVKLTKRLIMTKVIIFVLLITLFNYNSFGQKQNTKSVLNNQIIDASIFNGLKFRNLTPARTSGRVVDVAIHPKNKSIRFVAVASGGVWKTTNAGTTWTPVFDNQGSYSIGTVEIDKNNPMIVWVGAGENNAQRSVSKGDGIYKSTDGGNSWKNMGLKTSEHIGKIAIHPTNSDIVYVASQGSVWKAGGERGLYKTIDGGNTWERVLHISDDTGISDVTLDPRNPDILIASAYQRRRHFGILVGGGSEGGAFKSVDGGKTWEKLKGGFPQGELGRIGLARSPQKPDVLYALVAGTEKTKGFYRSEDNGSSWNKMNDYMVGDAQYYMEIFPDPHQFDKLYIVEVFTKVSEDGGKTLKSINHDNIHVDNHEIEFDLDDPNYLLMAGDGGIYESWDQGDNWRFIDNLPITQFYRVGVDNAFPFYNVYGGTQDNASLGGPSRTTHRIGIKNSDWYVTQGGDGFQTRIDPTNPNIVYSMSQYAGIVRYDKMSGEKVDIQPQPNSGEPPYKWNWDAPLLISAYDNKTLYLAANKLFKSTDYGSSWQEISPDLSRQMDRNKMEVMGKVWSIDAIFKNVWTSPYGTIVSLAESPIKRGLLYAGTDDGLIQVSEDDGNTWRKVEGIAGVPRLAYVSDLFASPHNENTVFAVFNNHKYGDYNPYFYRSDDKGKTWKSISSNLKADNFGWTILQDHIAENLLFAGTEYGLYFSLDGGNQWIQFKYGIPTIAIRDLEIQKRENDLVAASFGRGFYILDDYSPLRDISNTNLSKESHLFPVKDALSYTIDNPDGGSFGANFFASPNPTFGAVFTYYLKEGITTLKGKRQKEEAKKIANNQPVNYPDWNAFTKEKREDNPEIMFNITNEHGELIARVESSANQGINRTAWNLRYENNSALVTPGAYKVSMSQLANGNWQDLGQSQNFIVKQLENKTFPTTDLKEQEQFRKEVMSLNVAISNSNELLSSSISEMESIKKDVKNKISDPKLIEKVEAIRQSLMDLEIQLNGNDLITKNMELIPPSIASRVSRIRYSFYSSTSPSTSTQKQSFKVASKEFSEWAENFNKLNTEINAFEKSLISYGIMVKSGKQKINWND